MESAELLLTANQLADAVSRAYYGAFHYARLLLFGEEPVTHAGVSTTSSAMMSRSELWRAHRKRNVPDGTIPRGTRVAGDSSCLLIVPE